MIISTRGRYALRVMLDLAENDNGKYIAMKEVAARQDISLKYLEKILPVLVSAKMVEGVHGKGGGYRLTRTPKDYIIGDILRLTDGNMAPVSCLECEAEECERKDVCKTVGMWIKLNDIINQYFDFITLQDLLEGRDFSDIKLNM